MANQQVPVQVWPHTRDLLRELAAELSAKSGEKVSMGAAVQRAAMCLQDAHNGKAWLNGEEAGAILEERHRRQVLDILGVIIPHVTEGNIRVTGMSFDDINGLAFIHFEGGDVMQMGYRTLAEAAAVEGK